MQVPYFEGNIHHQTTKATRFSQLVSKNLQKSRCIQEFETFNVSLVVTMYYIKCFRFCSDDGDVLVVEQMLLLLFVYESPADADSASTASITLDASSWFKIW